MNINTGIPTTIKTMGVSITTIAYLRVLIIEIGSTIVLMVVEAQGKLLSKEINSGVSEITYHPPWTVVPPWRVVGQDYWFEQASDISLRCLGA